MRRSVLLALTLAMAGCGQAPGIATAQAGTSGVTATTGMATPAGGTTPAQTPAKPPAASSGSDTSTPPAATDPVALSRQTLAGLSSFTCKEQVYGKKNGVAVGLSLGVAWQAPANLRLDVEDTNLSQTKGSVLVFNGGSKVTLKDPSLPFFMQTVNLSVDDPRLQDGFGNRFDEATWTAVIANLGDPQAQVNRIGTATVLGQQAIAYQVTSAKLTRSGLKLEQIGLDPTDGKPLFIQQLDSTGVASQIVFSDYAYNSVADSARFSL